jgi:hypothetical protein
MPDEYQRIAMLIRENDDWRAIHGELLQVHEGISAQLELHTPHVRFSGNVMDAIAALPATQNARFTINKKVISVIAGVFIFTISALLLYMLVSTNWAAPVRDLGLTDIQIPKVAITAQYRQIVLNSAMGLIVMLGLVFFEQAIRMKRHVHH